MFEENIPKQEHKIMILKIITIPAKVLSVIKTMFRKSHRNPGTSYAVPVCYSFALAACHKVHELGGFNNRTVWSHSCGGQKSEVKVWTGLVPPDGSRDNVFAPVS